MSPRNPRKYVVAEPDIRSWLDELISSGWEVVAPVVERGPCRFERIESASEASLDSSAGIRTRWSAKEFLLPRQETLVEYSACDGSVQFEEAPLDTQPRVLFGLTPCDAAGLERLAAVFRSGPSDPYFQARRDATAVVTITCREAAPECFCTAVGGSPGDEEGSDVQITVIEAEERGASAEERGARPRHTYLVRSLTEKGHRLIENSRASWTPSTDEIEDRVREQLQQVEMTVDRQAIATGSSELLERSFDDSVWNEVADPCLGCRICTTVCPSCSCFDVYDKGSAACGQRCRCWDGCTQKLFTAHATGHNPRNTQVSRLRQRVLHKFSYFPNEHDGLSMCVGCGRCAALCPAGLDVHQTVMRVIERMQSRQPQEGAANGHGA
jgi:sulfhydrogenase subunit beta (sulfur reductase)